MSRIIRIIHFQHRGIHRNSIFRYDVESHRIMNNVIKIVTNIVKKYHERTYCECSEGEIEACKERCLDEVTAIQDSLVKEAVWRIEEIVDKLSDNYKLKYIVKCYEVDFCYVDVFLFCIRNDKVYQILRTSFQFSIFDGENYVYIAYAYRTGIYVPIEELKVEELDKVCWFLLPLNDNPENEEVIEAEIEHY